LTQSDFPSGQRRGGTKGSGASQNWMLSILGQQVGPDMPGPAEEAQAVAFNVSSNQQVNVPYPRPAW